MWAMIPMFRYMGRTTLRRGEDEAALRSISCFLKAVYSFRTTRILLFASSTLSIAEAGGPSRVVRTTTAGGPKPNLDGTKAVDGTTASSSSDAAWDRLTMVLLGRV